MGTQKTTAALAVATLLAGAQSAWAIDVEPGDYTPLPAGTNAILGYYQSLSSDTFSIDGNEIPASELSADVGILRYLRYFDANGLPMGFQAILPMGTFNDAQAGGAGLDTEDGLGDLTVGVSAWPMAAAPDDLTGTTLGVTLYASFPVGEYAPGGANLGNGGVTITPQVGLIQGLGKGFFLDASYDVTFTQDFDADGLDVSIAPLHQAQAWMRYQFSPATYAAMGYSGLRGGDVKVEDVDTGLKTNRDEVRFAIGHFINQTTQISGRVGYDVAAEDGFKSDPVIQLRLMKLF